MGKPTTEITNNYRCTITVVLRSKAKPTDLQKKGPLPQIAEGFKTNVGKSGQVFDQSHPYFQDVPKADQATLKEVINEVTPLPKKKD
jgi:hypothetical protein